MRIPARFPGRPAAIIGTGPSLESADVEQCRKAGFLLVAVNNAWEFRPHVHVTTNPEWWDLCREDDDIFMMMNSSSNPLQCWCSDFRTAAKWGLNHFDWRDDAEHRGLSADPTLVSLGHGSGFSALNIAFLMGCNPIVLLGHDMRYPKGYDAIAKNPGGKRHYFGEYPEGAQHWPRVKVRATGELDGLIVCYEAVAEQIRVEQRHVDIINCTPGSALECFPSRRLDEVISDLQIRA